MDPINEAKRQFTRREFFGTAARGVGGAALASLLSPSSFSKPYSGLSALPHFAPKAKRVIYLLQNGAPSHVDLFDHKPMLAKLERTGARIGLGWQALQFDDQHKGEASPAEYHDVCSLW